MNIIDKEKVIVHLDELGYSVVLLAGEYRMGFKVHKITATDITQLNPDGTVSVYERQWEEAGTFNAGTVELDKAATYLSGTIKWDGCCDMKFDAQEECMLHFCGIEGVQNLGKLLEKLYNLADKHIMKATDGLGGY
jgi:hypothetical protein